MLSQRHGFIFVHVPKTAGNAVQTYLLPHSDDRKVTHRHQDGVERFDVQGSVTPTKHAALQLYAERLGDRLGDYKLILPIRDPLDRALSLYFSPHRAAGRPADFVPAFNATEFSALLDQMPRIVDYIRVNGQLRRPDFLLRFESLAADLAAVAAHFGLLPPVLPILNRSLDQSGQRATLRQNPQVVETVRQRFAEDYAYFEY
jgi:hypothetical protein